MAPEPLKICLASSEFTPLAKTGGLADVSAALSAYLHEAGHDIRVLIPFYSSIDTSALEITPVHYLQNLNISLGHHHYQYSIDTARLPGSSMDIYLLRCPAAYDRPGVYSSGSDEHLRFILLSRVAIEMCQRMGFAPDIFHCHDWHTALIPLYLNTLYAWDTLFENTRSVLTIHNIGYQGVIGADLIHDLNIPDAESSLDGHDLYHGRINFLKMGLLNADLLTTVSPTYAREILSPEYGMGLEEVLWQRRDRLVGILNGVDFNEWDPETDPLIPFHYTARRISGKNKNKLALMKELDLDSSDDIPLLGIVSRLTFQKGIELVQDAIPAMMQHRRFALAVLGSGEAKYEHFFAGLQHYHRDRVCFYRGFNNRLAHLIEAGSDMFLMPSRFEPCGLNQMYSLRYGTIPIVRNTGGLADSVQMIDPKRGEGNGVLFNNFDGLALGWGVNFALDLYEDKKLWRKIRRNGMAMDYSWQRQGQHYVELFRSLVSS